MTDYRTVPVEPTQAMLDAMQAAWTPGMNHHEAHKVRWEAALSASPPSAGDLVERDIAVIRDMVGDYAGNEQWDAWSRIQNEMARLRAVIAAMQPGSGND